MATGTTFGSFNAVYYEFNSSKALCSVRSSGWLTVCFASLDETKRIESCVGQFKLGLEKVSGLRFPKDYMKRFPMHSIDK
jgi:hypothetical protein